MALSDLEKAELKNRRLYKVRARNFTVAVYDAVNQCFIGIREKFGYEYLFREYLNSVIRIDGDLNIQLPETIELKTDVLKRGRVYPYEPLFTWLRNKITEGDQNENHRTS